MQRYLMPRKVYAVLKMVQPNFFSQHVMDEAQVQVILRLIEAGTPLPRPVLVEYGTKYLPLDGHHRMAAYERLGRSVEAGVVPGQAFDRLCMQGLDAEAWVFCDGIPAMQVANSRELSHAKHS